MKPRRIAIWVTATAWLIGVPVQAQSGSLNSVKITVDPISQVTYGTAPPGSMARPEKRAEKLGITLQNLTPQALTNLTVRYVIFEQDAQTLKIDAVLKHDRPEKLKASGSLIFTSEVATVAYTPQHDDITNPKPVKKGVITSPVTTPVKAAGKTFAGYAIVIVQPNAIVAAVFNPIDRTNLAAAVFGKLPGKP